MRHRGALLLWKLATRLLPEARRPWGDAMLGELLEAETERAALEFAAGCVVAAVRERVGDVDSRYSAGLWIIALLTAFYAVIRIDCAMRGVAVLLGAPDGMREAFVHHGVSAFVIANYETARPLVVGCFLGLGIAHVAAAWFLSRGSIRPFVMAWSIAFMLAVVAVGVQLSVFWHLDGLPSEFHALLVQAVAIPPLLAWYHRQRQNMERG